MLTCENAQATSSLIEQLYFLDPVADNYDNAVDYAFDVIQLFYNFAFTNPHELDPVDLTTIENELQAEDAIFNTCTFNTFQLPPNVG